MSDTPLQGAVYNPRTQSACDHGKEDVTLLETNEVRIAAMRHDIGRKLFADRRFQKQVTSSD